MHSFFIYIAATAGAVQPQNAYLVKQENEC